jgi:hypothetical protein
MELTDTGAIKRPARLIANLLAGSWRTVPSDPNISEDELRLITPLLLKSGGAALAWWRIRGSRLSECAPALELKSAYQLHALHAAIHKKEIEEVITLLNAAGVEPVLVKGWAVARSYPEEGLRPYGDIDLCFLPEQYEEARLILDNPIARKYYVDLHDGFSKLDNLSPDELINRSEPVHLGSAIFRVLGPEDQFRMLCTHFLRHSGWRPLWLCDIAAAVETRPAGFDWGRCLGNDERQSDWIACAIGLAHLLLDVRVDDTPVARRAKHLPRWLIRRVMRNWDEPFPENYPPMSYVRPMATYLRRPTGVLKALRKRWPDPIEATVRLKGPFNESPRLPFQIGIALRRIARFLTHAE